MLPIASLLGAQPSQAASPGAYHLHQPAQQQLVSSDSWLMSLMRCICAYVRMIDPTACRADWYMKSARVLPETHNLVSLHQGHDTELEGPEMDGVAASEAEEPVNVPTLTEVRELLESENTSNDQVGGKQTGWIVDGTRREGQEQAQQQTEMQTDINQLLTVPAEQTERDQDTILTVSSVAEPAEPAELEAEEPVNVPTMTEVRELLESENGQVGGKQTGWIVDGSRSATLLPPMAGAPPDPLPPPLAGAPPAPLPPLRGGGKGTEPAGLEPEEASESDSLLPKGTGEDAEDIERRLFSFNDTSVVQFDEAEIVRFSELAIYVEGNPRKLKRIVNSYTLSRSLAKTDSDDWPDFREKLLRWTILCEQWPTRVSWILQILSDEQDMHLDLWNAHVAKMRLEEFYYKFVESRVYDTANKHVIERLREQYCKLFLLDGDPELFDSLIELDPPICMSDIGDLIIRQKTSLLAFTTNLNPAVRFSLAQICAHREDAKLIEEQVTSGYRRRTIFDLGTSDTVCGERIKIESIDNIATTQAKEQGKNIKYEEVKAPKSGMQQLLDTSGALEDSKSGPDLVGYKNYAVALAQILLALKTWPLVIGLYASWGTGKSFIMKKVVAQMQYAYLLQRLQQKFRDCKNKGEAASEEGERQAIQAETEELQGWLDTDNENSRDEKWKERIRSESNMCISNVESGFDSFIEFFLFFREFPSLVTAWCCTWNDPTDAKDAKDTEVAPEDAADTSPTAADKPGTKNDFEYEFVWFNAWLYNGTDNLWAALILKLYEEVEKHYGPKYAFAQRRALLWALTLKALLATFISTACVVAFLEYSSYLLQSLLSFASAFAVATTLVSAYHNVMASDSESATLIEDVKSELTMRLGFMDVVKTQLFRIGELLEDPLEVPTVWNYFLPEHYLPKAMRQKWIRHFSQRSYGTHKRCRFVLFVDDLDRCDPEKCVEVLASINLMCEGLPFVIFLAIDPRVVVCSIETVNSNFYSHVGISGYSYLDKIVQMPFAIPELCRVEKQAMLRGYLTGKGKSSRDYSNIKEFDKVIQTRDVDNNERAKCPGGIVFIGGNLFFQCQFGNKYLVNPDTGELLEDLTEKMQGMFGQTCVNSQGYVIMASPEMYPAKVSVFDSNFQHVRDIGVGVISGPRGVAASKSTVYISDTDNDRLIFCDIESGKVSHVHDEEFCKKEGYPQFNYPSGLVCIRDRMLAVCDRKNDRVQLLTVGGAHIRNVGEGRLSEPNDVQVDADGNLIVCDTNHCRLALFNEQGTFMSSIMPGFFKLAGYTFIYITCCPATGRVAIADDDNHRIALLKPYFY